MFQIIKFTKGGGYMYDDKNMQVKGESKTAIGVLCGLFLGIIGLIIGLLLYKDGSFERQTFIKGWVASFVIAIAIGLLVGLIFYCVTIGTISSLV